MGYSLEVGEELLNFSCCSGNFLSKREFVAYDYSKQFDEFSAIEYLVALQACCQNSVEFGGGGV